MYLIWPYLFGGILSVSCITFGTVPYLNMIKQCWDDDRPFILFMSFLFTIILAAGLIFTSAIGFGLADLIGSYQPQQWQLIGKDTLVNMRSTDGESGRGGLLYMEINQSSTYFYYRKMDDGGIQQAQFTPDANTEIFEENRIDGELDEYSLRFVNSKMNLIATPGTCRRYEFHTPMNSVQKVFILK